MGLEGLVVAGEVVHVRPPPLAPPPPLLPLPLLLLLRYCPPLMLSVVDTTATSTDRHRRLPPSEAAKVCGRLLLKDGAPAGDRRAQLMQQ